MIRWFYIIIISCTCSINYGQELKNDDLQGFNLFLMPEHQIDISLSLDSNNIVNPNTGFSITPGVKTIDMVSIYNNSQTLQSKPYTPNANTDFGRLSFKKARKTVNVYLENDRFAREFKSSNPAFFEANRNTALHRSYNPLSCYRNAW
ncbi:hypothetical protein [uncultured Nonlabens sp.]|uniref:hypothetical protein n=1 Tax=uncultured Nonlabens sp. TaxID=859306 RepID=UPI00260B954B|nr:hypothetical protein [uncultured Nonlabens sp.]